MPSIGFREVTVSSINLVESAANTFTQYTVNLSNFFSTAELEAGVVPVEVDTLVSPISTASGANVATYIDVQLTKNSKSAMCGLNDSDLLFIKRVYGSAGANATCINFQSSHVWPNDGKIQKSRSFTVSKTSPYLYAAIKADNQANVRDASMRILCAYKIP
jgi:hypothetical protein